MLLAEIQNPGILLEKIILLFVKIALEFRRERYGSDGPDGSEKRLSRTLILQLGCLKEETEVACDIIEALINGHSDVENYVGTYDETTAASRSSIRGR